MFLLVALFAATWLSYTVYRLLPVSAEYWQSRLGTILSDDPPVERPLWKQVLAPFSALAMRFMPTRALLLTRTQLYWAHREGHWRGWSESDVWGLRIALALVGLAYGVMVSSPLAAIVAGAFGFLFPGMRLDSQAERLQRRLTRDLPEFAQLLVLLSATGTSLSEALRRLSEGDSHTARWLRETLALAAGKPLFTPLGASEIGVLRQRALDSGHMPLINLTVQLDLIEQKGLGARELLNDLADTVAGEYHAEVETRANALGSKLILPVMLFYFLPYLFALLAPLMGGVAGLIMGN